MINNQSKGAAREQHRNMVSIPYMLLGVLFCVCLIAANLLETKQISIGPLELTAGLIVFPVSYIINDCMVEVWGYRRARLIIWLGFAMNFLFVLFGFVADWLPLIGMAKRGFMPSLVWHLASVPHRLWPF